MEEEEEEEDNGRGTGPTPADGDIPHKPNKWMEFRPSTELT